MFAFRLASPSSLPTRRALGPSALLFGLAVLFLLCFSAHALEPPIDPALKASILQDLQNKALHIKRRAIQKLSRLSSPWARDLLLKQSRATTPQIRWFAIAALRRYPSDPVKKRLRKALNDRDARVRLNALYGLSKQLPTAALLALDKVAKDKSPLVRAAWCLLIYQKLKQPTPQERQVIERCLADRDKRVRVTLARSLLDDTTNRLKLHDDAKQVIAQAKRQRGWMRKSRFFGRSLVPGANLRRRLRQLRSTSENRLTSLSRWYRNYRDLRTKETMCMQMKILQIKDLIDKLVALNNKVRAALKDSDLNKASARYGYSEIMARRIRMVSRQGARCFRKLRRRFRTDFRLLNKALWFDEFPIFFKHPNLKRLILEGTFLYDSFVDALRDDQHPAFAPQDPQERKWDLAAGIRAQARYQWKINKRLLLRVEGHANARYFFLQPALGIFGGGLDLKLLYGRRTQRNEQIAFLQLQSQYTQDPPEDSGWPYLYAGERLEARAAAGYAGRWFTKRYRSRRHYVSFRLLADVNYQQPNQLDPNIPLSSGLRLITRGTAALRYQIGTFGFELWTRTSWVQTFNPDNLPRAQQSPSSLHLDTMFRLHVGNRLRGLRFIIGGGLGAFWPLESAQPQIWIPNYTPIFLLGLASPPSTERYPIHWSIFFERKQYPSPRFNTSFILEHVLRARVTLGAPPPQLRQLAWRKLVLIFATSLHFLEVHHANNADNVTQTDPIAQNVLRFAASVYFPLNRRWGIEWGLQLDFVNSGFRRYLNPETPGTAFKDNDFLPRVLTFVRGRFALPL